MRMEERVKWLKRAFLLGALTDACAIVPMLHSGMAHRLWGFESTDGKYGFAMRFGASLMAGWTLLLLWASREPLERRAVGLLTMPVVAGFVATEIAAVRSGEMDIGKAATSWILQATLSVLFVYGYLVSRGSRAGSISWPCP
jgi:hypothetical protein